MKFTNFIPFFLLEITMLLLFGKTISNVNWLAHIADL